MAKITYNNKTALITNPDIADENKVTDNDMNEIKSVVNENDDKFLTNGLNISNEVDEDYRVNLIESKNLIVGEPFNWNLNNSKIEASSTRYAYCVKVAPSTTYTISRSAVGGSTFYYYGKLSSAPYIGASVAGIDLGSSSLSNTITTDADTQYIVIFYGAGLSPNAQVEKGNQATTYEEGIPNQIVVDNDKYTDTINVGASLDSRSRVNVLYSHNLLDTSKVQLGVTWAGFSNSDRSRYVINEGGTYTISCESLGNVTASIMIANSDYSSTTDLQDINVGSNITLQFSKGSHLVIQYAKTNITKSDIESAKIMIVEGSTSRAYEHYITPSIYVDNDEIYSEPVVLWQNPNTSSTFAGQTITLNDSLVNYSYYEVIYLFSNTNRYSFNTGKIVNGTPTMLFIPSTVFRKRDMTTISGNQVTFLDAFAFMTYGSSNATTTNEYLIPYRILGYK